jgi:hypothetical protein
MTIALEYLFGLNESYEVIVSGTGCLDESMENFYKL